ncbi:hypothetical protein ANCCEY_07578 [Ancylostoma ceylanicum]|uniref:MULE transposase domain-containing protein n=1 Tax=Ancylostoma ceylanicum TaxID=53326 RepID=A0A0D6M0C8_9BILA|nr:hypothetical protein ANCCEY_07578 [Ancylostoma ceylanicum]
MMNDLAPELGRRKRAAWGAYKSIEDVVKKTNNIKLRAHLFNTTTTAQALPTPSSLYVEKQPGTSTPPAVPTPSVQETPRFRGEREENSQVRRATFQCQQCKKLGKLTAVKVKDDEFLQDPAMLGHTCEAVKRWPTSVSNVCVTTWTMLCSPLKSTGTYGKNERMSGADATKREKVLEYFVRGKREYESRGSAFARAVQGAPPPPDMDNKAVEAGLFTLVADGIHQMNPRSNRRARVNIEEGQLYTIHGVCEGEIEAPFLYAIALHKREQVHVTIYREMKKAIQLCSPQPATEPVLRIILDFEKHRATNESLLLQKTAEHVQPEEVPKIRSIVLHLQSMTAIAMVRLTRTEEVKEAERSLRRRDPEQRLRMKSAMQSFEEIRHSPNINADQICEYLRMMSRLTSNREI